MSESLVTGASLSGSAIHVDLFGNDTLHPLAYDFFTDDRRFVLALAGRRGAKTYTGAKRMLRKIWMQDYPAVQGIPYNPGAARRGTALWWDRRPRLHYWVVADEYKYLDEPKRYLLQFLPPALLDHADNAKARWWLRGDVLIEFKTAHKEEALVGSGLSGVWVEEADRMGGDAWLGYLEPTLTDKGGWAQFTTTPLGMTWTYDHIEKPARDGNPDFGFHTWRSLDNDRIPNIAAKIASAKLRLPSQYFKREYEASREAFFGQIYSEFDEHTMAVHDDLPKDKRLWSRQGGQDWGFGNPGAAIVVGMDNPNPNLAHVWVVDERYAANRLCEDYWIPEVLKLNATWKFNDWACDPEAPGDIARYVDSGIHAVGHKNFSSSKWDEPQRSVKAGIRTLATLMKQGRFHVLRRCKNLIEELKTYRWAESSGSKLISTPDNPLAGLVEAPAKGQRNHACDALRYATTTLLKGANFEAMDLAA